METVPSLNDRVRFVKAMDSTVANIGDTGTVVQITFNPKMWEDADIAIGVHMDGTSGWARTTIQFRMEELELISKAESPTDPRDAEIAQLRHDLASAREAGTFYMECRARLLDRTIVREAILSAFDQPKLTTSGFWPEIAAGVAMATTNITNIAKRRKG